MDAAFLDGVKHIPCINTERLSWLYYSLVLTLRPRVILESGIFQGYTTCFIAKAAQQIGAHVIAVDNFSGGNTPEGVTGNLARLGLADTVTLVRGDALLSLQELKHRGVLAGLGMAILDDVHTYPQVSAEIDLLWEQLEEGGVIGSHDTQFTMFPGCRDAFLDAEKKYGRDGLWLRHNAGFALIQKLSRIPRLFTANEHDFAPPLGVGQ